LLEEQRVQAANQEQKNQEAKILSRVRQYIKNLKYNKLRNH
jgi:hypothetical protein